MRLIKILGMVTCLGCGLTAKAGEAKAPDAAAGGRAYKNVDVAAFEKLRADTNVVVLDVRTAKEFAAGHIPGAVSIDWLSPDFEKKASELDRSKTYLVQCATGRRSANACEKLAGKLGFAKCYNLEGGIKAWQRSHKPVTN